MRILPIVLFAVALPSAFASHPGIGRCDGQGAPALGIIEITGGTADTTFYVDDRNLPLGNGIWTYQESNGVWSDKLPGVYADAQADHDLQRGGGSFLVMDDGEICNDGYPWDPDQVIW